MSQTITASIIETLFVLAMGYLAGSMYTMSLLRAVKSDATYDELDSKMKAEFIARFNRCLDGFKLKTGEDNE